MIADGARGGLAVALAEAQGDCLVDNAFLVSVLGAALDLGGAAMTGPDPLRASPLRPAGVSNMDSLTALAFEDSLVRIIVRAGAWFALVERVY